MFQSRKTRLAIASVLYTVCLFNNVFSFLNIELEFMVMTPFRTVLLLATGYCTVMLVVQLLAGDLRRQLKSNWFKIALVSFFAAWSACGLLWILFGQTGTSAKTEVMGIITTSLLVYCSAVLIQTKEDVKILLKLCVGLGLLLAVFGHVEAIFGSFIKGTGNFYTVDQKLSMGRIFFSPTSVFYNTNDYAAFLLLNFAVLCGWIIGAKSKKQFLMLIFAAVLMISPTPLIGSTIFELCAGTITAITVCMILLQKKDSVKKKAAKAAVLLLAVLVYAVPLTAVIQTMAIKCNRAYFTMQLEQRMENAQRPSVGVDTVTDPTGDVTTDPSGNVTEPTLPSGEAVPMPTLPGDVVIDNGLTGKLEEAQKSQGTVYIRLRLITAGLTFFLEQPLTGYGPWGFRNQISQRPEFLKTTRHIVDPHCFYAEMLSQYGGILFAAYMAIVLFSAIVLLKRSLGELRKGNVEHISFLLVLMAFSAAIMIPSSVLRLTPIWIYFILSVLPVQKEKTQS